MLAFRSRAKVDVKRRTLDAHGYRYLRMLVVLMVGREDV